MSKYRVSVPYIVWVSDDIEADSKEEAIEKSYEEFYVSGYCGNGGTDRLVGVTSGSIESDGEPAEGTVELYADAEEI